MNRRSAFTIVELLLVVAIIAALISIVIYSMRPAREAATRTKTLNGLRQMVAGYVGYATDNRAILLPGYCDFEGPAPRLESGESLEAKDKISYVWRLAPYLDHHWRTVMVDYHNDSLMERFEREYRNGQYGEHSITPDENSEDMGIATMPSIGLNSLFLGSNCPWPQLGSGRARRLSEVRSPARQLVFAPSGIEWCDDPDASCKVDPYWKEMHGVRRGFHSIIPPFLVDVSDNGDLTAWGKQVYRPIGRTIQRTYVEDLVDMDEPEVLVGFPLLRWTSTMYPYANLDGSVAADDFNEVLTDMRRWSPALGLERPHLEIDNGCN